MKMKATTSLTRLTVKRDKDGEEEGDVGTDLYFTGQVHLSDLKKVFNEDHGFAILEALYDAEGNLASLAFANFTLSAHGTAIEATFKTEIAGVAIKLRDVEADQFELAPKVGRQFDLSFRIRANQSEAQIGQLAEKLKTDLVVDLWSRQGELHFGPPAEEEETEKEEG